MSSRGPHEGYLEAQLSVFLFKSVDFSSFQSVLVVILCTWFEHLKSNRSTWKCQGCNDGPASTGAVDSASFLVQGADKKLTCMGHGSSDACAKLPYHAKAPSQPRRSHSYDDRHRGLVGIGFGRAAISHQPPIASLRKVQSGIAPCGRAWEGSLVGKTDWYLEAPNVVGEWGPFKEPLRTRNIFFVVPLKLNTCFLSRNYCEIPQNMFV